MHKANKNKEQEGKKFLLHNVDMMNAGVEHIDKRHHACKEQVQLGTVAYMFCKIQQNL